MYLVIKQKEIKRRQRIRQEYLVVLSYYATWQKDEPKNWPSFVIVLSSFHLSPADLPSKLPAGGRTD